MRTSLPLLLAATTLTCGQAMAQAPAQTRASGEPPLPAVEVTISNKTLQLRYLRNAEPIRISGGELSAGIFLSEDRDTVLMAGLLAGTDFDMGRLNLKFGPRAYAALLNEQDEDVFGLSIGAELRFDILPEHGLAVQAFGYYAPDILTFGAADKIEDYGARIQVKLTQRILGFAGWRWFRMDLNEGRPDRTLQDQWMIGLHWQIGR